MPPNLRYNKVKFKLEQLITLKELWSLPDNPSKPDPDISGRSKGKIPDTAASEPTYQEVSREPIGETPLPQDPRLMSDASFEKLTRALPDRYRIIRELGRGGFANVYLAYDRVLDQEVAIKALKLDLASQSDQERFMFEARIGAKLRHPNIATVFDVLQTPNGLLMVMEYYPGGSMADFVKKHGALRPRLAMDVVRQVSLALGFAHRRDIIHRDIKPANIFRAGEGIIKLGDFGIASYIDTHEHTQTGMVIGTPLYMAPEQAIDSRKVDPRTDLYSLGLTLYYMLTALPPRVIDLEYIQPQLRSLLRHLTEPERNKRLVSADQLIAMIDQIDLSTEDTRTSLDANEVEEEEISATMIETPSTRTAPVAEDPDSAVQSTPREPSLAEVSRQAPPSVSSHGAEASAPPATPATAAPASRAPKHYRGVIAGILIGALTVVLALVFMGRGDQVSETPSDATITNLQPGTPLDPDIPGEGTVARPGELLPAAALPTSPTEELTTPAEQIPGEDIEIATEGDLGYAGPDSPEPIRPAATPTPSPTPSPSATPSPTPTAQPTATPVPTPRSVPKTFEALEEKSARDPLARAVKTILLTRKRPETAAISLPAARTALQMELREIRQHNTDPDPLIPLVLGYIERQLGHEKPAQDMFDYAFDLNEELEWPYDFSADALHEAFELEEDEADIRVSKPRPPGAPVRRPPPPPPAR